MFTDIVGSTELAAELGDRSWKALVSRHNSIVRRELKRFAGRELDTAGDGFFVMFERPAQAIDCAWAILDALAPLKLQIRAAIHMGEVEVMGGKVGGIAVHAASRVLSLAKPGQIYVTGIVHDVVAGSDIRFADAGVHELRGVPGEWRIFAVEEAATDLPLPVEEVPDPAARRRSWKPLVAALLAGVALTAVAVAVFVAGTPPPVVPVVPHANSVIAMDAASRRFVSIVDVADPTALAVDEGAIWVLSQAGRTVTRIDPATRALTPIGLPASPTGLAIGGGAIWITTGFGGTSGGGAVLRIGLASRTNEGSVDLSDGVEAIAVGEGAVWAANRVRNSLTRIDLTTRAVNGEIATGEHPEALAVGDGAVWIANAIDHTIWRIDAVSLERTSEPISMSDAPQDLALGFGRLWVTSTLGHSVTVIDATTSVLQRTVDLGGPPRGIVAGSDAIWIALSSGEVVRIDADDQAAEPERIELTGAPEGVVVDGGTVWISVRE
jgi:streptogramin lyase